MIWLLAACVVPEVPSTTPCDAPSYADHPRHAEYQRVLERFYDDNRMPGAIVGVQRGDEPPWVGAVGLSNLAHGQEMQACTPFRGGSIAKMVVGTLVVQLADAGEIGLDDPISDHLPELADEIDGADAITIRHLLGHTSGLRHPSDDDLGYQLSILDDPEAAAARPFVDKLEDEVYGHSLRFEPGTAVRYSNAGYWVLGLLVERLTGRPIEQALDERLFAPNGLDSMRLVTGEDATIARGYSPMDGALVDVTDWDRADSDGDPAGGVAADAEDLLAFARLLFDGSLVSPEALEEMTATRDEYGLGIESLTAYPSVGYGKNGTLPGVDANVFLFPEEALTLVIFSNWGAGNRKDVFDELFTGRARSSVRTPGHHRSSRAPLGIVGPIPYPE